MNAMQKAVGFGLLALAARSTAFVQGPMYGALRSSGSHQVSRSATVRMVSVGQVAPDFKLMDQNKKTVTLSEFRKKQDVVVFFYPKDDTPGCTAEAKAFQSDLAQFQKLKAKVIGISSDEDHKDFVDKYGLKMTLLSDVGGKVRKEWKVKGALFGALDGRVTYVIDKNGVVKKIYDNLVDGASHSKEALSALTS